MVRRRRGKVIFMSSVVGILSGPFVGMYGASKHALEAIAETMSMELQEFGIEVAVINPGFPQFEASRAFSSIADVVTGKASLFRNVITPDLAQGVKEQSVQVWSRQSADGLGTRHPLVQSSRDLRPETLVGD